jgi:DNA-binding transcriptional regulator GbsR (MarR family)
MGLKTPGGALCSRLAVGLILEVRMVNALDECKGVLVRRWGELGGYWGINRTMAEMHALLFVSSRPLCTDDIMQQLHVSRGNASMNLRALVDWGLIRRVHQLGDRKEYFEADTDVWRMFETITRERRRREVEPIMETIDRCRQTMPAPGRGAGAPSAEEVREFARRLDDLRQFLATMSTLFDLVLQFGHQGVSALLQLVSAAAQAPPTAPTDSKPPRRGRAARSRPAKIATRTRKVSA